MNDFSSLCHCSLLFCWFRSLVYSISSIWQGSQCLPEFNVCVIWKEEERTTIKHWLDRQRTLRKRPEEEEEWKEEGNKKGGEWECTHEISVWDSHGWPVCVSVCGWMIWFVHAFLTSTWMLTLLWTGHASFFLIKNLVYPAHSSHYCISSYVLTFLHISGLDALGRPIR